MDIEKIYQFALKRENFFYDTIKRHETNSVGYYQCLFSAGTFQQIRYFIESLMEEENLNNK